MPFFAKDPEFSNYVIVFCNKTVKDKMCKEINAIKLSLGQK
jgi:hypothetical protein